MNAIRWHQNNVTKFTIQMLTLWQPLLKTEQTKNALAEPKVYDFPMFENDFW